LIDTSSVALKREKRSRFFHLKGGGKEKKGEDRLILDDVTKRSVPIRKSPHSEKKEKRKVPFLQRRKKSPRTSGGRFRKKGGRSSRDFPGVAH